jgi:hypothetical protein
VIKDNYAQWGGGIADSGGKISECVITGNRAIGNGGGIVACGGPVSNCVICGNWSNNGGGTNNCWGNITNCTIVYNRAISDCGGVRFSDATVSNCIIWGNSDSNGVGESAQIDDEYLTPIEYCCIKGWTGSLPSVGNIADDPCFIDSGSWDANGTPFDVNDDFWVEGDYHLQSQTGRWDANSLRWTADANTSVCIDAGDPNSAWRGELWPNGKRINMGAYGGTAQASMSLSTAGSKADFNCDDVVDFTDLCMLTEVWLVEDVLLTEDINRNGFVDFADFAEFARCW